MEILFEKKMMIHKGIIRGGIAFTPRRCRSASHMSLAVWYAYLRARFSSQGDFSFRFYIKCEEGSGKVKRAIERGREREREWGI